MKQQYITIYARRNVVCKTWMITQILIFL